MEGTLIELQTPPGTVADLGKKVKAKYPGTYDALPDDEVGRRVKAKYPDAYGGFVDVTTQPQTPPTAPFASAPPQAPPSVSGPTSEQQSFERDFKTTGTVSTAPRGEPSVGVSAQPPEPSSTAYALPAENDPIFAQRQKLLDTAPPGLLAQDPKWQGELVDIARFGQVDTQPVFRQFSQVGTVLSDTDPRMQKIMADYAAYGPGKVYSAPEIQARKAAGAWTAKDQARFEQGAIDHQRRVLEGRMLMVSKVLDSGELSNEDVAGDVADIQHGFDYLDHAQTELALRDKDSFSDRLRKAQQARTDAGHGLDATDAQVIAGLVGGTERTVVKPLLMAWNYLTKVDGQYTTTDAMIDAIDEASKDLDALVPTKSKEPVTKEGMNGGLKMVNPGNIIPQLAGASANMAPFLAVGGVGGSAGMALGLGERFGSTAALFGTTYADSYDRFVKDAIEAGSTQSVAEEYAPFAATIEATLMSVNPAATGRSLFGTSVRNSMLESIKDGLTPRTAMRKALDGAMKAGVGGLEMSGLVLATDASKNVVNRAVNEVSGSDLPEKASGEDIANSVMQAFLMGAVFNVGHQIVAPNVKGDAMHMAIMNPEATAAMFSKAAERGDIKPEQAAELAEKFNRMQLIYHGNDLLKEDPETAYKVASRLYEKQENERSLKEAPPDKTILEAKGDPRVARNEEIDKENLKDLGLKLPGETSKPSLGDPTGIVYEATSPQSWRTDDPIDLDQAELDLDLTEARIKKGIYRKGDFARTEFGMRLSSSAVSDVESALETNPEGAIAEIRDAIDKKRSSAVNEQVQEAPPDPSAAIPANAGGSVETEQVAPVGEQVGSQVGSSFNSASLQEAFGYTPEVAEATVAIADAMGLDKSKIKVVKGGGASPDALFQDEVGGWYSRLDNSIAAKGSTMPASQWKTWMEARAKEGALSMEEAKWTGLSDWLTSKGNEKVTPQQVREFLKESRVRVEVKELDDETSAVNRINRAISGTGYYFDQTDTTIGQDGSYVGPDGPLSFDDLPDDVRSIVKENDNEGRAAKFSQYQLPGGENYREVLVTLPVKGELTIPDDWDVRNRNGRHEVYNASGALAATGNTRAEAIKAAQPFIPEWKKKRIARGQGAFVSSHFDEPNILVHLRLNDRTGPNGEKILFIEELQSDWGQSLKKVGVRNDQAIADAQRIIDEYEAAATVIGSRKRAANDAVDKRRKEIQRSVFQGTADELLSNPLYNEIRAKIKEAERDDAILPRLIASRDLIDYEVAREQNELFGNPEYETAKNIVRTAKVQPPSAPFITSTDAWVELGLKQAIRMAAQGGYDRIAWTTGEQQNERYDLSKQVSRVTWTTFTKEKGVTILMKNGAPANIEVDKSTGIVTSQRPGMNGRPLDEVVGKDMADKIMSEESGDLSGDGLKVGGSGMKGFYDKILPTVAKKVSKRLGGGGNVVDVELRGLSPDIKVEGMSMSDPGKKVTRKEKSRDIQQSISITQEMKAKVQQGIPLMQGNKASVEFTQAGEAIIRALKNPDASTGIHELAHVARRFLFDNSIPKENRAGITDEHIHTAEKWSGAKDGKWGRDAEEKFARGFERYLRDGLAPNDSLRDLFAKFAKWLRDIYANLFSSPVKEMISPEMRKVYNALVSRSEVQNEPTTAEAPPPTQAPTAGAGVEQQSEPTPEVKKTVATKRAYEGDFRQEVKDEIEKGGLYRNVKNREETWKNVGEFVGKVGIGSALDAVRNGDIRGDNAAAVFAYAIKDVQDRRSKELDAEKWQQLVKDEAALVQESGDYALESGRYGSMMGFIYENTDLGFSAAKIADEWKRDFDQEPPPAVQDLMKQVEELRAKIDEANKKAAELEEKMAVEGIKESVKREGSKGQAAQRRAFADRIRSLKIKPQGVASSFIVPPQLFNAAVEAVALAVQTGESVASAITKGIKLIQQSDWYKNLSKSDQLGSEKSFEDSINGVVDESVTEGRISIPKSVIREEVKRGAEDIDALVERVKAKLGRKDVTDREVRDAITGYGRKVNMSKDEIDVEIRKQKRIGRLISALEDVRAQKRPAKNIVERDKIDAKEKALKAELKQAIKDLPPDLEADERKAKSSLEAAKTRALASIEELQRRLKEGDFAAKKGPGVTADAELRGLRTKMQQIREKYELEREKERRRRRNLRQKIYGALMDVLNVPKSLVSSLDFSAPLRQGVILSAGNPRAAMRAGKEMFAQAFSQEKADEWLANLKQTEDYKMMRDSGLYLAEPTMSMNAKEESFMSNLAEKIPIYGQLVKGSGRAYAGYLNKLRADVFMYGTERLRDQGITPENDPKSYTEWAHFINNATGRGRMHRNIESAAPLLNTLMFSPRYLASRVNLMNPVTYARMPKEARKMAMKNMISAIGFYAVVATMLAAGGADTEDDPESSDFGKLRFGNTRYDLMAGFQQLFVFFSRLLGHISRGEPVSDTVQRFARSKASPTVGTLINLDQGKDMVGDPVTLQSEAVKLALPLYVQDMKDVYDEGGATGVITSAVPAVFGVGVQTYKPRRRDSERSDPHETRPSR